MAEAKKKTTKKTKLETPENLEAPVVAKNDVTKVAEAVQEKPGVEDTPVEAKLSDPEEAVGTAKAGKRSAKAQKETAEKVAKEERKASGEVEEQKPKKPVKPTRSRLERRSKGYRKSAELIEKGKLYSLDEAVELVKKTSSVKFDATVELHVNLGVDPRHADQNIRDNVVLPAGTGKTVRIAVLTDDPATAKKAGAETAGTDELLAELDKGNISFDVLIATPTLMPRLGKYARVLGPRGLMPNPKSGTVTTDIDRAVAEAKAGKIEYRVDTTGIVHVGAGKVSFDQKQLLDNLQALLASLKNNKPQSVKGNYIQAIYLTSTMGPSIKVDPASLS
jgi:large subunit ribosomal protein L1